MALQVVVNIPISGFPEIKGTLWGPCNADYNTVGHYIIGLPLFLENTKYPKTHQLSQP